MMHEIHFNEVLCDTPAVELAIEAAKNAGGFANLNDYVVWATSEDEDVVGVLCWQDGDECARVTCAYVEQSSRGQGVFRQLVGRAIRAVGDLDFALDPGEEAACEAVEAIGGVEVQIIYRVPDPNDATGG